MRPFTSTIGATVAAPAALPQFAILLAPLLLLTPPVSADLSVLSQFVGAPKATFPASLSHNTVTLSGSEPIPAPIVFTACTDYLLAIQLGGSLNPSVSSEVFKKEVSGVCNFCTGVGQSHIDSCCAASTSLKCFEASGDAGAPALATAQPTGNGGSPSTPQSSGGSPSAPQPSPSPAKSSGGAAGNVVMANADLLAGSFAAIIIGIVGWLL